MSFFENLFLPYERHEPYKQRGDVLQESLNKLKEVIQKFYDRYNELTIKCTEIETEIKQLITDNKKEQAKRQIKVLKMEQENGTNIQTKGQFVKASITNLESMVNDKSFYMNLRNPDEINSEIFDEQMVIVDGIMMAAKVESGKKNNDDYQKEMIAAQEDEEDDDFDMEEELKKMGL